MIIEIESSQMTIIQEKKPGALGKIADPRLVQEVKESPGKNSWYSKVGHSQKFMEIWS